jgi:serine protease SohB
MGELAHDYLLFLLKAMTVALAIGLVLAMGLASSRRFRLPEGRLRVRRLNDHYRDLRRELLRQILPARDLRRTLRRERREERHRRKAGKNRRRIFVLDFRGDVRASGVAALREEISAVIQIAGEGDEVLLRLENAGGLVHEHGLAASQLDRLRQRGIKLTVAVDKIAASGGYMMACVADRILAAPFAVVGSIGVLGQVPNFHRLLDRHGVEVEEVKAGSLKRTLTWFGENTDEDREHFREQVERTHELFKRFVAARRPALDMARVATGEHWFATEALDLKLVDAIETSDDYLLTAAPEADLLHLRYCTGRPTLGERLARLARACSGVRGQGFPGLVRRAGGGERWIGP